ncbi:MAG: 1-acyl-sn-glycerol-3-phosphate acyltransferase [Gelidibacter sp.]
MKRKNKFQLLWLHYMRSYLRLALFLYYKKIEINYKEPLRPNQARLFLGNHQNGLMDPLIIATKNGQFSYFLTRASVFKKAWVSDFLKSLLMIPVYRVRDGWDQLSKNGAVFKTCSELLHDDNAIVLFPEGNHNIKRFVRPLSKGFTRILQETQNNYPELNVEMVPVGLNYRRAEAFADSVVLNFGAPISSKDYQALSSNASVLRMKIDVHSALTKLTTHIDADDYDEVIQKLEKINVDFLNPEEINQCIATHFENCKTQPNQSRNVIKFVAKTALSLSLFLPYGLWKLFLEPKIKEPEFTATFRFGLVISLVPIFMLIMAAILWVNFGVSYAFLYLISVFILDLMAVKL